MMLEVQPRRYTTSSSLQLVKVVIHSEIMFSHEKMFNIVDRHSIDAEAHE